MIVHGQIPNNLINEAIIITKDAFGEKIGGVIKKESFQKKIYKLMVKGEKVIYIQENNRLKGIVTYGIKKGNFRIKTIAVSRDARGQGIGSKLFDYIINYCKNTDIKTLSLEVIETNPRAKKLYESIGFQTDKTIKLYPFNVLFNQKYRSMDIMKKNLYT